MPKEKLENEFLEYLKEMTPDKRYLKVMRRMALEVWDKKYKDINKNIEQSTKELERLKLEKGKLFDMLSRGLIDENDFKEQLDVVKQAIEEKQLRLFDSPRENYNFEEALDLCFDFFLKIPDYWSKATYDQKIKLQGSIFSQKPFYKYPSFETPNFSLIFQQKKELACANSPVVAPTGIEPVFSH